MSIKQIARVIIIMILCGYSLYAAELAHRWGFNGDLVDSVGGLDAVIVVQGGDAVIGSSEVTLAGGNKGSADYIDLPDGLVNALGDSVTFEVWATQHSVQNWSRIFDFGSSTYDNLFMSWTMGTDLGSDRVEWSGIEDDTVDSTNAPYELDVEYHIALVVDGPNNLVSWYSAPSDEELLGPARGSFETTHTLSELSWDNVWLGQSQWGDSVAHASYNELRIWQGALTSSELQKYHELFPPLPPLPYGFYPENEQTDVELDVVFQWPGISLAKTYDLYVGTDFNAVSVATRSDATDILIVEYDLTETTYTFMDDLEWDQTYYWRVDPVNIPDGSYIYMGRVFSFSTEPTYLNPTPVGVTASSYGIVDDFNCIPENTINGSGLDGDEHSIERSTMWRTIEGDVEGAWIQYEFESLFRFNQMHIWNHNEDYEYIIGIGVKDAEIRTSLDGETWTTLSQVQLSGGTGKSDYTGEDVDMNDVVAQFIRLEIISQQGFNGSGDIAKSQVGLSEVQFYAVPIAAYRPSPEDGDTLDSLYDELIWRIGRGAQEHRLYLDVNEILVAHADPNVLIATTRDRRYDLANLDLQNDQKYFWRVDEVYDVNVLSDEIFDANRIPGPVWDFNTPELSVEDDM